MRLDGPRADGLTLRLNWCFTDTGERAQLTLEHAVLSHRLGAQHAQADATLTLARSTLDDVMLLKTTFPEAVQAGRLAIDGDAGALRQLLGLLDTFDRMFPVVGPRPVR